jgi:hypothetical protein
MLIAILAGCDRLLAAAVCRKQPLQVTVLVPSCLQIEVEFGNMRGFSLKLSIAPVQECPMQPLLVLIQAAAHVQKRLYGDLHRKDIHPVSVTEPDQLLDMNRLISRLNDQPTSSVA